MSEFSSILGSDGLPMRRPSINASSDTAWLGASRTNRALQSWNPSLGSADGDLSGELVPMTARARDLDRNDGTAKSIRTSTLDNVIGPGLRLNALPEYKVLGWTKDYAEEWSSNVESLWRSYSESTDIDYLGQHRFSSQLRLVLSSKIFNGAALALSMWHEGDSFRETKYKTCVQLIDIDRMSNPNGAPDSATIRHGVEFDKKGRVVAVHIRNAHPGDGLLAGKDGFTWTRVPIRTEWGRRRVLHVFEPERVDQSRGVPLLASVLSEFKVLSEYKRSEIQAAAVNALVATTLESTMTAEQIADLFGGDLDDYLSRRNGWHVGLKPGAMIPLFPGDKLNSHMPARPNAQFGTFMESVLRNIAAGVGIPYELIMKDFSKTNYSSARAAMLEAWRNFQNIRKWMGEYFASPVYELWLEEAISLGDIEAPGFYENRRAYSRCRWIGPGKGWIDPVKEAQASQLRIDNCLSTLEAECSEQGLDWEEVIEQRAREVAKMKALGLTMADLKQSMSVVPTTDMPSEQRPSDQQPSKENDQ